MVARAEKTVHGLKILANTVKGLSQMHLRTLSIACVRPRMTYACVARWKGMSKTHTDCLEKVQRQALRLICAAFKPTPIVAMGLLAAIPPIKLHLNFICENAALHFTVTS